MMDLQHGIKIKVIECDNEITDKRHHCVTFLEDLGIKIEPSSIYAQAQNGLAERSGGVIKDKERVMRIGARLSEYLWPEIRKTAVYLYNRTPNYKSN